MNRDRANRIVDLQATLQERDTVHNDEAGDDADDEGAVVADYGTAGRDGRPGRPARR